MQILFKPLFLKLVGFIVLLVFITSPSVWAEVPQDNDIEMADLMRSNGKIYIVVAVITIIFAGLMGYMLMLDRKVKRLEQLLKDLQ